MSENREKGKLLWQFYVALEGFHETGRREDFPFDLLEKLRSEALPLRQFLLKEASHSPELFRPEVGMQELSWHHHQAIKGYTRWHGNLVSYGDYGWCAIEEGSSLRVLQGLEEHIVDGIGTEEGLYLRTEEGQLFSFQDGMDRPRLIDRDMDEILPWKDGLAWRKGSRWWTREGALFLEAPCSLRVWTEEALCDLMEEISSMPETSGDVFLKEGKGFFLGETLWRRQERTWVPVEKSPGRLLDVTPYHGRWVGLFQKGEVFLLDDYGCWLLGRFSKMRGLTKTKEGIRCGGWDGEEILLSVIPGGDWDLFSQRVREKVLYG